MKDKYKYKIRVHYKHDLQIFIILFILVMLHALWWDLVWPDETWLDFLLSITEPDMAIVLIPLLILSVLFLMNIGFRVFEWDDQRFCIKSMCQKRCYKWDYITDIYFCMKFGKDWIYIVTRDGNFHRGFMNYRLMNLLKEKCSGKWVIIDDPMDVLPMLRRRRKKAKQKVETQSEHRRWAEVCLNMWRRYEKYGRSRDRD